MTTMRHDTRRADRIRAAICIALVNRGGASRTIPEIVDAVRALGIPLDEGANKVVADAIRWEVSRGRVRKVERGRYAAGDIPRSTLHYMRVRVAAYVADPSRPCVRPSGPAVPASVTPAEPESAASGLAVPGLAVPERFGLAGADGPELSERLARWDVERRRRFYGGADDDSSAA